MEKSYQFAIQNDMWYDISTGDILTYNTVNKLLSTNERIFQRDKKIVAKTHSEIVSFNHKVESNNVKILVIDNWDRDFIVLSGDKDFLIHLLRNNGIGFKYDNSSIGNVFFVEMSNKNKTLTLLRDNNAQVTFSTKESVELIIRSGRYETAHYLQPSHKNQDRIFQLIKNNRMLSMIFDGHGGNAVIEYIDKYHSKLGKIFTYNFPRNNDEALRMMQSVLKEFLDNMKVVGLNTQFSGSTFVFAYHDLMSHKVMFGNIGDSRVVWSLDGTSFKFSKDHKPNDPIELKRVTELGGNVTKRRGDVFRVEGNLAISRAIGDTELFPYVIPEVEVYGPFQLQKNGFYVMASDGVFDVMENNEMFLRIMKTKQLYSEIRNIAVESKERGSRDDISIIATKVLLI